MTGIQEGRPLKIAMFSDNAHPGAAVYELARGLADEGAEVDVFCLRHDGEADFEAPDGFRVHRTGPLHLERPVRWHSTVAPKLPPQAFNSLRANPPDVVGAHGTSFAALVAGGVAQLLKRPLITTIYDLGELGEPIARRIPGMAYEKSLVRALVRRSDRVICRGVDAAGRAARLGARPELTTLQPDTAGPHDTLEVYVEALAERELRWFLQKQVA
jgi:hypothetical protein